MTDLLVKMSDILKKQKIEYWVDQGTLLGLVRDGGLIPWEYDVDIGVMEENCDKISNLKQEFLDAGLTVFGRKDRCPHKQKLLYDIENHRFYYGDPWLVDPCARVYDTSDTSFWVDIYWYKRVSGAEATEKKNEYSIPPNYNFDEPLYCSAEGIRKFHPRMPLGGCLPQSAMFPLHFEDVNLIGATTKQRSQPLPNNAQGALKIIFGPKSLETPYIKGWKAIVCGYWLHPWLWFIFVVTLLGILILCIVKRLLWQSRSIQRQDWRDL